tara:strand:- start:370 stop:1242 length:873 start_codon:yes stop_codon:yes gene_type:complete
MYYFEQGGDVPLQDDGSLPGVDDLRFMTPAEVEEGSYAFLQDLEEQMMYHLSEAQNPANANKMGGVYADRVQHHYQEAEKLRDQIEQFRERRASAILNYPDSETKMYMKEGQDPYVRGFPDSIVQGYEEGGIAIPQEDMDDFVDFIQRNRPSYKEGETTEYRGFGSLLGMQPVDPNATVVIDGVQQQVAPQKPKFAGRADPLGIGEFFKPQEEGGFADPYFPQRPIEKQDFSGIRGFQMSTKIKLNDRDDAVGTKLMRQAGMQASANQVMDNLDPKILAQMSRILGRDIG